MGAIQVNSQPQRINTTDSARDEVLLINDGPSTVYLSDNSGTAASPYNSVRLPPLGTMTWKRHRDLYAATLRPPAWSSIGNATDPLSNLIVADGGNLSVFNYGNTERVLYIGDPSNAVTVETSGYASLHINFWVDALNVGFDSLPKEVTVTWYNATSVNPTVSESFSLGYTSGSTVLTMPVRDAYCRIVYTAGSVQQNINVLVVGSMQDRDLNIRIPNNLVPFDYTSVPYVYKGYSNGFWVTGWNMGSRADRNRLYISALTTKLTLTITNQTALTGVAVIFVYDAANIIPVSYVISGSVSGDSYTFTIDVPTDRVVYLLPHPTAGGTVTINGTWH